MCYLKKVLFIISALLLPSLKTDSHRKITENPLPLQNKLDSPVNDIFYETSPLPCRRQNPGQSQFRPPSDIEISRLLTQYRGIVNKYGHGNSNAALQTHSPNNQLGLSSSNNTDRFYLGHRGPIRHNPHWSNTKSTGAARQRDADQHDNLRDMAYGQFPDPGNLGAGYGADAAPGPMNPDGPPGPGPGPATGVMTTQNEAMGAASRFTTRTTTTRRRRRTTPVRVSFAEECDYIAYYCLKAYDTGKVCARTLYFIHVTFKNYCMVDYVNCMERYDIWQIAHMGECFELKILTEYLHYPYNDDYFLDNYYIVEDM